MYSLKMTDMINQIGINAKKAARILAKTSSEQKNHALQAMSKYVLADKKIILEANKLDIENSKSKNLSESFIDRLELNDERVKSISDTLLEIESFKDPVGKILDSWQRPNGMHISRVSTPLGVIGIIFESRPNVTADAGALSLKAGNASILRGGSDSINSCLSIDVIVPRGGKSLVSMVEEEARVPVFAHLEGICHIFVDKSANLEKSLDVCINAKMRRPGICGAVETILVHSDIANDFMPLLINALKAQACEIRGCAETFKYNENIKQASEKDWSTEYLLPIVSIKIVNSLNDAIKHIEHYSSGHTESILTEDLNRASKFQKELDSAIVMHNVSTQFADGGEFGLGGEIGIATGKFHARGPVGVDQLTSFKYLVNGNGHTRN
ncbi:MAG: glutamate-5-semialdehyde dehydrogenase [Proteobacteria bacterium]|nr:glutamate-5-semialdehyde dehydrogenase [Pseudomonadota bacterium]